MPGSRGDNISHFNAVRFRGIGTGNLKIKLRSYDNIQEQNLADIPMAMKTNIQPTRLANFMDQRCIIQVGTDSINDYFKINRIILFSREHATSYPG